MSRPARDGLPRPEPRGAACFAADRRTGLRRGAGHRHSATCCTSAATPATARTATTFEFTQLCQAGFGGQQLRQAGSVLMQLRRAGFDAMQLR